MNRNRPSTWFLLAIPAMALAPWAPVHAAQSYDNCTGYIDTLPATISIQGTWCLRQDLVTAITSGVAITVAANNVTIDCNDHKLGGLSAGPGSEATGIDAANRQNVTVRHCVIRGFYTGIRLDGTGGGHLVEDNRLDLNLGFAILVHGDNNRVQRNRVYDTGGISSAGVYGIHATADVVDNIVAGMTTTFPGPDPQLIGIFFFGTGTIASGNRVRFRAPFNSAETTGIRAGGSRQSISGNHAAVVPATQGWALIGAGAGTTFCRDNHVGGFQFAGLLDCDDKGGNAVH
jgi:hypothetical protein